MTPLALQKGEAAYDARAEVAADLTRHRMANTLAFMFETRLVVRPTRFARDTPALQADYDACWAGFDKRFDG